jgi:flavin-binding protein dodecin
MTQPAREREARQPEQQEGRRGMTTPRVAKIVELIGVSDKGWEDAAQVAVEEARKTIHGITGVKIKEMTAKVDQKTGQIVEYKSCINLSFGVMDEERG